MNRHPILLASAALFALFFVTPSHAQDDGSRFAAIWERSPGPEFIARHALPPQLFQQEHDQRVAQGYCLSVLSGYAVGGQARYAAIWERQFCPGVVAQYNMSAAAYQQQFNTLASQGFRLKLLNGYSVAGQDRYAAIWLRSAGPPLAARVRLTSQTYQREFDQQAAQGYCLTHISGYSMGGQAHYAAIWEESNCAPYVVAHGLRQNSYEQKFNEMKSQNYRVKLINGYRTGGTVRYAVIFEQTPVAETVVRYGMPPDAYQLELDTLTRQGFRPKWVSGY